MAACVPRPSQVALQKVVVEKIGLKFLHAVYIAKLSETMFSELAVGFKFLLEARNETRAARARSPAACRGGGGP